MAAQSHLILLFKQNVHPPVGSEAELIVHRFINSLMRSKLKGEIKKGGLAEPT